VQNSICNGESGRGFVIQDIHAPAHIIWQHILDFSSYPNKCPRVKKCDNYETLTNSDGSKEIKTCMQLGVCGIKIKTFIDHRFYPNKKCLTWTLDYSRRSDVSESVGYWYIESHPDTLKHDWSRVFFSVDVITPPFLPNSLKNILKHKALSQSTHWVKEHSEKTYEEIKDGSEKFLLNPGQLISSVGAKVNTAGKVLLWNLKLGHRAIATSNVSLGRSFIQSASVLRSDFQQFQQKISDNTDYLISIIDKQRDHLLSRIDTNRFSTIRFL